MEGGEGVRFIKCVKASSVVDHCYYEVVFQWWHGCSNVVPGVRLLGGMCILEDGAKDVDIRVVKVSSDTVRFAHDRDDADIEDGLHLSRGNDGPFDGSEDVCGCCCWREGS